MHVGHTATRRRSPVDAARVKRWLRTEATTLSDILESVRIIGETVDHLIALLVLAGVPLDEIRALLPENVATPRRKQLGSGAVPAFLAARRSAASAADGSAVSPTEVAHNLGGPGQRMVWRRILASAHSTQATAEITAADLIAQISADGAHLHVETARRTLERLTELGAMRRVAPGHYVLTTDALTFARSAEDADDE